MKKENMEIASRKSITAKLKTFSPIFRDSDWIEVTEWTNGDGWDISIGDNKHLSLHIDELEAINFLCKYLDYGINS